MKIKKRIVSKFITIILIQTLLMFEFAWAEISQRSDCLSPALAINDLPSLDNFEFFYFSQTNEMSEDFAALLFETRLRLLQEKLEKIFRKMGIGKETDKQKRASENDMFANIKTAYKQGKDVEKLIQQKEAELKTLPDWVKKDKKELIRDNMLLVFLENNQLPVLRRAGDAEIRKLAIEKMIKEMGVLQGVLDFGSEEEVLKAIANSLDVIEEALYPGHNFSVGTHNIMRENLKHWIKKVFFWVNHDRYNPHAAPNMLWDIIRGYVEHAKAYVRQRELDKVLEEIRRHKHEELGEFKKGYVLDYILVMREGTGNHASLNSLEKIKKVEPMLKDPSSFDAKTLHLLGQSI